MPDTPPPARRPSMNFHAARVPSITCPKCDTKHDLDGRPPLSKFECQCGTPMRVPMKAGDWTLLKHLGKGRMTHVFKGYHEEKMRTMAIKVPYAVTSLEQFVEHAEELARIVHDNVLRIYQISAYRDQPMLIIELVNGGTLKNLIDHEIKLTEKDAIRMTIGIAQGLQAAHHKQITHGNLTPTNILLSAQTRPKVSDFGFAFFAANKREHGYTAWKYDAPEVIRKKHFDHRADIYSLGYILYEMVTGEDPFLGPMANETPMTRVEQDAPLVRSVDSKLSPHIEQVIQSMIQRKPDDRYENYDQLLQVLRHTMDYLEDPGSFTLSPQNLGAHQIRFDSTFIPRSS